MNIFCTELRSICRRIGLERWRRSQSGGVLPIIGLCLLVVICSIGMAIDLGRAQIVQAKLYNAVDTAALAAGAQLAALHAESEGAAEVEVERFVHANFPLGFVGTALDNNDVEVSYDGESLRTITVTASVTVPTTFMRLLNRDHVIVSARSVVTRATTGLELALVLDNTGSMGKNSNQGLNDLKAASKKLLNTLYGEEDTIEDLHVGIVPFSQAVNIGTNRTGWMVADYASEFSNYSGASWGGCVEARASKIGPNHDANDTTPATVLFQPYFWPDDNSLNNWIGNNGQVKINNNAGPNLDCPPPITPLTQSKTALETKIDHMTAEGYTHINLGAVWGLRLLSPNWRGQWGGGMNTNSLPRDYGENNWAKAMVIMTDGDNTFGHQSWNGNTTDPYTAYRKRADEALGAGVTTLSSAITELDSRLTATCNQIKTDNRIIVYTVTYGADVTASTKALMRNCATSDEHYFDPANGNDMSAAFTAIGDSLSNLRISE